MRWKQKYFFHSGENLMCKWNKQSQLGDYLKLNKNLQYRKEIRFIDISFFIIILTNRYVPPKDIFFSVSIY